MAKYDKYVSELAATSSDAGHPQEVIQPAFEPEGTFTKALGFYGLSVNGNPARVDVKNGRIVRIRPLHYDEKYDPAEFNPGGVWKIQARGKTFEPSMKTLLPAFSLSYKKRAYSPNRIKYPLKRVDWDPNGERHPENRGKSKYKRISWDEATDLIANEIRRVQSKYGPYGILAQGDGHGETKVVHGGCHACHMMLLQLVGGYTLQVRNPDSWEGWYWGAKHVWGMEPFSRGHMWPQTNLFNDVSKNTDMILYWGCDPETTPDGFEGKMASRTSYWFTDLGIKQVYVCPDLNYGAAVHADKWIPVLPNTDAALHLAIAYTWMTEGTYDKDYVATHTYGFDKFQDYVLGKEDGVPKTPEWASEKCGVPTWTIKALAREWASKTTSVAHTFGGSYIRGAYSTEPARLEALLLGMQGLGKPGVHQINFVFAQGGMPRSVVNPSVKAVARAGYAYKVMQEQLISKVYVSRAILDPPISHYGSSDSIRPTEDQFIKYTYPIPKEKGGTEIHMMWMDNPCLLTCWNGANKFVEMFRSPKIECIVAQHPWLENDSVFADIILPINTKFEEDDIASVEMEMCAQFFSTFFREGKCIEPMGESKSDYEAVGEVAKKLGVYEKYTGGKTVEEWIKEGYDKSGVQDMVGWEELNEKGYYVVPTAPDWEKDPVGLIDFYNDPEGKPLITPTGKIEFYATGLAKHFPDDDERPPVPHWIEKGESHDERLSSERAKKYPLLMMSNHGRWRVHAQFDDISWLREIPTCKVKGWDGYMYEPLWIHPSDAAKRGIKSGDIVKVHNERGTVLSGAMVWERIMPGVVYQDHGARVDFVIPGELDRGGAINLICPLNTTSRNATGEVTSGYLVEVEKVSLAQMEEWRKQNPEAFEKEYDPASGLRFNAWVEGGM